MWLRCAIESGVLHIPGQGGPAHTSHGKTKPPLWVFQLPENLLNGLSFTVERFLRLTQYPGLLGPGRKNK